ncbi:MAG: 3-oxoacyl-[acyl-carrier-protein] synthase 2 [Syntrophus sp. SKADARSKE-3]|nr:3-oxoacyl-[acyl-carrier-protein] synthase 2 [Syntrophus sp. SKADARSKE-3]
MKEYACPITHDDARRVVVTGMGMVTPLGIGKKSFADALFEGISAVAEITSFDTALFPSHLGAEVTAFSPRDYVSIKSLRRLDKLSLMVTAAARLALEDANITVDTGNRDRIGIIMGTAFAATDVTVRLAETIVTKGSAFVNPIIVPNTVMNAPAGHASIELGFRGVNTTVTHFAVSAETAIAYGVSEIRRGAADFILAGGGDILSPFYYEALTRFRALSPLDGGTEGCRPFDESRNGTVAGEGCGILCIESLANAKTRGRIPYCEITGVGLGSSVTAPAYWPDNPAGVKRAIVRALKNAGLSANHIQVISAAANGGPVLDATETAAYNELFTGFAEKPFITALKGAIGESFSGGGIRACALALSLDRGILPPTVGLKQPISTLPFVMEKTKTVPMEHSLLTGISFGGTYACLIFSRCDKEASDR